ncbi:hypothetical protein ACGFYT_14720 [Streptomyces sp. NPDC048208]
MSAEQPVLERNLDVYAHGSGPALLLAHVPAAVSKATSGWCSTIWGGTTR